MNRKIVFHILGQIIQFEALLLVLPLIVSFIYNDSSWSAFAWVIAICIVLGSLLIIVGKTNKKVIFAKEGFAVVSLSWIVMSAIGALPFVISGQIPNFIDAFFETVSGFTTTGASVLQNVEGLTKSMLFWRSFTHWVGGMGVLVFIMAIVPSVSDRSIHIMRAEVPGPIVGKLVPRIKDTAKILYIIYIIITFVEIVLLWCGDMDLFEAAVHSFGTAGTGGFGIVNDSIASYSTYSQIVITVFMLVFGINFNIYFLILIKRFKSAFKSRELWFYISVFAISSAGILVNLMNKAGVKFADALRLSTFQSASFMTTTGYGTAATNDWPVFSKGILFILMFLGAMAGSTAGGLKLSRIMILFKAIRRELKRMLHPRSISTVRFEGKPLDDATIHGTLVYFALFMLSFGVILLILCIDNLSLEANISSVASCINNIGPAFGEAAANYSCFSYVSKIALSFAMLLGRLELYPVLFLFSPTTWTRNK